MSVRGGIYVYGAGNHLTDMLRWHPDLKSRIARIFDKNPQKVGKVLPLLPGKRVESIDSIKKLPVGTQVAISALRYFDEIVQELHRLNPGLVCLDIDMAYHAMKSMEIIVQNEAYKIQGMLVYGVGDHLKDMIEWHPELPSRIVRIFDKDETKRGKKAPGTNCFIESKLALKSLPAGTKIAVAAIRYLDEITNDIYNINPGLICENIDESYANLPVEKTSGTMLRNPTKQDVIECYKKILGRSVESDKCIDEKLKKYRTLAELQLSFYKSAEFKKKRMPKLSGKDNSQAYDKINFNRYHLFPFEQVPQGAHIILCGAGEIGQWYLAQLQQSGYAKVVSITDRDWASYPPMQVQIVSPERLPGIEFDYVVICTEDKKRAQREIQYLVQDIGVEAEKIITSEKHYSVPRVLEAQKFPVQAWQPQGIPVAVCFMPGGIGDIIIYKRKIEELLAWDRRIVLDIYACERMIPAMHSFFDGEYSGQLNAIVPDNDDQSVFYEHRNFYAFSLRFTVDIHTDVLFDREKLSTASNLLDRCLLIEQQSKLYGSMTGNYFSIHYARCKFDGFNCYTSFNRYDGFDVRDFHTHIPMQKLYGKAYECLGLTNYITVNCGVGMEKDNTAKCWPIEYFSRLIRLIREVNPELYIVQVDDKDTPKIEGCDKYLLGESLELVKYVLRGAKFHIGIEGGLVHVASQLDTKCAVLFGPTPMHYYSYDENINISEGECHDCYWYEPPKHWLCYRRMTKPECMYAITPEIVVDKIKNILY